MIWPLLALAALVTFADLIGAFLFVSDPANPLLDAYRICRDGLAALLALWGFSQGAKTGWPFVLTILYAGLIGAYVLFYNEQIDFAVITGSAAKLLVPAIFLWAGYGAIRTTKDLQTFSWFLCLLAVLSTAFGAWDIRNTEFWTETLQYGHYLASTKGVLQGFDSFYALPFNFFGFEGERRAAGIVAAPLAQGSMVAIGTILGFAHLRGRSLLWAGVVLAVGLLGVWQSGTRGAMLMLLIALPFYLLASGWAGARTMNVAILALVALISFNALAFVYSYSVNFEDGSTIGHYDALMQNLDELKGVMVTGPGVGASGSIAADAGMEIEGGGEGALFSVIYQIGLPGGLLFLLLYGTVGLKAFANRRIGGPAGELALACAALALGIATSLFLSDHLFSVSGTAVFWMALGGSMTLSAQPEWNPRFDASPARS